MVNPIKRARTFTNFYVQTGIWYHLVVVKEGSQGKIYVNGVDKTYSSEDLSIETSSDDADFVISNLGSSAAHFVDGLIDEVRIYNRALSTAEIQKHYAEGLEKHQTLASK